MKRRETRVPVTLENVHAAGSERRCVCGLDPDAVAAGRHNIVLAHDPADKVCPDCGRDRQIVVMHPDFPLDDPHPGHKRREF